MTFPAERTLKAGSTKFSILAIECGVSVMRRLCSDQCHERRSKISFAHFTSSLSSECTEWALFFSNIGNRKNYSEAPKLSQSQKASNEKHNYNNTNDIKHIILLSFA
jgi:hypothetical protein